MIIEIAGMPRSGKTRILFSLSQNFPNSTLYPERFDLIPFKKNEYFNYNFWYAKYCVKRLLKISNKKGMHLFDRGIIDRIAFGNALSEYCQWEKRQHQNYMSVLKPFVNRHDLVLVNNIKPENSLKNIKNIEYNITHDIKFLKTLHQSYQGLENQYENLIYLSTNYNLKKLTQAVLDILKNQ